MVGLMLAPGTKARTSVTPPGVNEVVLGARTGAPVTTPVVADPVVSAVVPMAVVPLLLQVNYTPW